MGNNPEIVKSIEEYLLSHRKMTLATVTTDGRPISHTVEYASDGTTVIFVTSVFTRKAQNIMARFDVAYSVDEDYEDWTVIKGVQMEGRAEILKDKADIDAAAAIFIGKFPIVATFPPNPNHCFIRIKPVSGFFLDYTKGFTHRDAVEF